MTTGAELESHFYYGNNLRIKPICDVLELMFAQCWKLFSEKSLIVYGENFFDPIKIYSSNQIIDLNKILLSHQNESKRLLFNLEGQIYDVCSNASLHFDFTNNIITLSVSEAFIWSYNTDVNEPKIERLLAYYKLCRSITQVYLPKYILIGNSETTPSEIRSLILSEDYDLEHLKIAKTLSFESANNLYEWYTTKYIPSMRS